MEKTKPVQSKLVAYLGVSAVLLFLFALLIFGLLNQDFSFLDDYISQLGAKGAPFALGWNLIGFVAVGLLLLVFGFNYGILLEDRLLAILLSIFGLGFAFTAIPMDMQYTEANVSKAHILAVCLGLASWLFGLARISYNPKLHRSLRRRANVTAILLVFSMLGFAFELWSMPITHRLVFGIVFGWTAISSFDLITKPRNTSAQT